MCGRKTLTRDMQSIIEELAIEEWQDPDSYFPSYNIAPMQKSPVLVFDQCRKIIPMRWGLVPSWAKDQKFAARMINARAETLLEKPAFKHLLPVNRCLVLSDGYYEWKKTGNASVPYYIYPKDGRLLLFAGLWDRWVDRDGTAIHSYTIITTSPWTFLASLHDRMPVILDHHHLDLWIKTRSTPLEAALRLLAPTPRSLSYHPVSNLVNSPRNNGPDCIRPATVSE